MKHIIFTLAVLASFAAHATPTFSDGITPELKQQILQDFEAVKSLNGANSSALYKQIFANRNLNGADLLAFLEKRITNMDLDDCGGGPTAVACVISWVSSDTMWITPNYVKFNMPQIFRISALFHESRHTEIENDGWSHVNCPVPYLDDNGKDIVGIFSGAKMEGVPACDETPLGAYGMQVVLLKNVEKNCANCSDKVKMDAKLYSDDNTNRLSNLEARKQLKDDK